jgi:hypothetical protein
MHQTLGYHSDDRVSRVAGWGKCLKQSAVRQLVMVHFGLCARPVKWEVLRFA